MKNYLSMLITIFLFSFVTIDTLLSEEYTNELSDLDRKYLFAPMQGRIKKYAHILLNDSVKKGDEITADTLLGTIAQWPNELSVSQKNDELIKKGILEYNSGRKEEAFNIFVTLQETEQDNRFFQYYFALTLYWSSNEEYQDYSFELFRYIEQELDKENDINDHSVLLDYWFPECYWKLATLYLDEGDYGEAIYELSRSLLMTHDHKSKKYEQALQYLTEAYFFLNNKEYNTYIYNLTKRLFPKNVYVDDFHIK